MAGKPLFSILLGLALFCLWPAFDEGTNSRAGASTENPGKETAGVSRIISLAPSLTETLFAIGLGDRIVGVTDYCNFPPEAKNKQKIGGFIDPSLEAIVALNPDLVVLLPDHKEIKERLQKLGVRCIGVPQYTVSDILASLDLLGKTCKVASSAIKARKRISFDLYRISNSVRSLSRPRVALAVGHELTGKRLDQACLAGPRSYLDELIRRAGGTNALEESGMTYPSLSREGLACLNPDIVIDLVPSPQSNPRAVKSIQEAWKSVPGIKANHDARIFVMDADFIAIPGPRVSEVVASLARLLHPEATW